MINVIDKEKVVQYKGNQKYGDGREQVAVLTLTMDGLIWKAKFEKSLKMYWWTFWTPLDYLRHKKTAKHRHQGKNKPPVFKKQSATRVAGAE